MEESDFMWKIGKKVIYSACGLGVLVFFLNTAFYPIFNVWAQQKQGEAELAHAQYNRQIATLEAMAKKESAKSLAEAEVIRAEGVARANKIIGESLENNEGYLRYLYITQVSESSGKTIIYVPTEAGLPILESQRLNQ